MSLPNTLRQPTSHVLGEEAVRELEGLAPAARRPNGWEEHLFRARDLLRPSGDDDGLSQVPSNLPAIDHLLGGGLWRGELTELRGRPSSGRLSLALTFLAAITTAGEAAAFVDLGDGLDAERAEQLGVDLTRLLWARPRHVKDALAATEIVLASALPLVVLELGMPPLPGGRGPEAGWLRLARVARQQRSALLVSAPYRVSGTAARAIVELRPQPTSWSGTMDGPRLLIGSTTRLWCEKHRRQPHSGGVTTTWRLA